MPRPRGKCGKIIYDSELEAKIDMARQQRRDIDVRRVQECNICPGEVFHLTSQRVQRTQKRTSKRAPQSIDGEAFQAIA